MKGLSFPRERESRLKEAAFRPLPLDSRSRGNDGDFCLNRSAMARRSLAINVSVGKHWEEFIDALVKSGRYASATEIIREGLRLVEEREAKFKSLRETIQASLAEGGENSIADARARIEQKHRELEARGR